MKKKVELDDYIDLWLQQEATLTPPPRGDIGRLSRHERTKMRLRYVNLTVASACAVMLMILVHQTTFIMGSLPSDQVMHSISQTLNQR